ncbi:MAG TPA: asparagine synthase (glutamine-hydrolyzing), partial [Syntrophobacteraceae bacterium]|nr:asparagine synthase (glutamine-hydrolyzing) [Syntrophobacteraceae bacterium]
MSAIAGIHRWVGSPESDDESMHRMLGTMSHRGPSDVVRRPVANSIFGFRGGPAMDRSVAHDPDKRLLCLIDGEIFHIHDGFDAKASKTRDAQNILNIYQQEGDDFVSRIDGSYTICLWDGIKNKLIVARDRLGSKPVYYFSKTGLMLFASEAKAIITCTEYDKAVNLRALDNFLTYGYVPYPDSLLESIRQVMPGHMLICRDGTIEEKRYWKFTYDHDREDRGEGFYKEKFLNIFERAVSRRLSRHPEAGFFLSGGLDTSGVAAVSSRLRNGPLKAFTVGFREERYNEIGDAKIVADHLGLEHHTFTIECNKDFPRLLEKIAWHYDSPFVDTSAVPSFYVAELAVKHVDTVLTGDFPDQLIGGSGHHVVALARRDRDSILYRMLRNENLGLNRLVRNFKWSAGSASFQDKVKRFIYRETFPLEMQRIILGMPPVPTLLKHCLYSSEMIHVNENNDPLQFAETIYRDVHGHELLDKLLYFDVVSYAVDDLMTKVERMCMAHGLNAFTPFHDIELVEFIAALPTRYKIKGSNRKYIMRQALRGLLPEAVFTKKKQGFAMPIGQWLVNDFSGYVREILLDPLTMSRGYFDKKFLTKMVEDFLARRTDYASGS